MEKVRFFWLIEEFSFLKIFSSFNQGTVCLPGQSLLTRADSVNQADSVHQADSNSCGRFC